MKTETKMSATTKSKRTLIPEPQYGGTLRIANTYVPPPRMGVPAGLTSAVRGWNQLSIKCYGLINRLPGSAFDRVLGI